MWKIEPLEGRVVPATITVLNANSDGAGSLHEAIDLANTMPGPDTIAFAPTVGGTITLSGALPDLSSAIAIEGPGPAALTVARSAAPGTPEFRIFTVTAGAEVTISGLTITGGMADRGGGIANSGMLTIANSTLNGNTARGGLGSSGGGISNSETGTLTIAKSTLGGNSAVGSLGGTGGGIANAGAVTIANSTISGNSAVSDGGGISNSNTGTLTITDSTLSGNSARTFGGGISNLGTLTVVGSTFSGNSADFDGGGIANISGMLTVADSTLSGNSANGGGGISNTGTVMISDSTLSGNSANGRFGGSGGGISNSGVLTITDSTLSGNSAGFGFASGGFGGGIENSGMLTITASTLSGNTAGLGFVGTGSGGGITNSGMLTIIDSTLSGNLATGSSGGGGGGISNSGTLTITASTLSGNTAAGGPERTAGFGGGIANAGALTITNSTLSGNTATGIDFGSGGIGGGIDNAGTLTITASTLSGNAATAVLGVGAGGGIYNSRSPFAPNGGTVTVTTSLFANAEGGNLFIVAGTQFVSRGHNLFSDTPGVALDSTDLINTDPLLGPLADNGGPTFTHALLPGSPAINAGAAVAGITTDQRGVPRPQGFAPDIGAFESRDFANRGVPTVLALQRFGFDAQPTTLVLSFSTALDPARAQDLGNYRLVAPRHHGRAIRLRAARYDAAAHAVTLTPARRLSLHARFLLTVNGTAPGGLASTSGVLLDGSGNGRPGSDFVTRFGADALAGSSDTAFNKVRYQWAGPGPFGGLQFAAPSVTARVARTRSGR